MAETKTRVPLLGQMVDASEVPIITRDENSSTYTLEDGTTLRFRSVALSVIRLDGQFDGEGNPIYLVKNGVLVTPITVPESLRKHDA